MNGSLQIGITGKRPECGRIIGLQQVRDIELLRIQIGELQPSQIVLQVTPDPCHRVQLGTLGRGPQASHLVWPPKAAGRMRATMLQEQDVHTVGNGVGEGIDKEWEGLRIPRRPCQQEPRPGGRGHRPIDVEPCEDMRHGTDGLHPARGEAPPPDRQYANAAFIWAAHAHRAGMRGRDGTWQLLATGRLALPDRLRVFWCDWAVPP
jgi:hypothetical protein